MPRLIGVPAFVHVAEQRSFRAAARILGVTPTAVSKAVSRLEEHLGARLLERTSRHVALTPEGELYLRHCRAALDHVQAGEDAVTLARRVAQGVVRASISMALADPVMRGLERLRARYPGVSVELSFSDREVSLAGEELDVAVRIGPLVDSSLVATRLRSPRWVTVASPTYLARAAALETPADLVDHVCLRFARPDGGVADFRLEAPTPRLPSQIVLDDGNRLVDGAILGLGVTQAFDFMVEEPLRRGALVEVLEGFSAPGPPVHALTPRGRRRVPRVRAFLELLDAVLN